MADLQERWCLVTGGRGFAARHLVDMLIHYDIFSVRIADLGPEIKLETHEERGNLGQALRCGSAQYVSMDLRNKSQVFKACDGVEVVFHMAASDSTINNHQLQYSVNVHGTKNIIDACTVLNVKRLIYTSSPSVVFDGKHGILDGVESMPYPAKHNDSYSSTKAEAEALVIKANGMNGLLTCCIRPSSIFGPGDKLLVPSLVVAARKGKSKFIIGDGKNMYDFTYVENVAHAHVCAERALASGGTVAKRAAGEAYFITNMEPIRFWEFISLILAGLGYKRPKTKIPTFIMMLIAYLNERIYRVLAPYGMRAPQLTPCRIRLVTCNRTFSSLKANDRLGYRPLVPLQEGLKKTIESYSDLRAEVFLKSKAAGCLGNGIGPTLTLRVSNRPNYTKSILPLLKPVDRCWQPTEFLPLSSQPYHQFGDEVRALRDRTADLPDDYFVVVVGDMITEDAHPTYQTMINTLDGVRDETGSSGNAWAKWTRAWTAEENRHVADILLWRDVKLTLGAMLVLYAFHVSFVLPGNTLITAICKLFIVASVFLFMHGKLPDKLMGYPIEKISESNFRASDTMSREIGLLVVSSWNRAVHCLRSISRGSDSMLFFKMALSFSILSLIGSMSLQSFFTKVLPFAFVAFYIYELREDEIDGFLQRNLPIRRF